jgi:hypothetical protein
MPPKRKQQKSGKAKQQPQITTHVLPLLKKPMETIGKQVNVRGDYYEGKMTAAEKETLYKHTVRDFTNSHKFPNSLVPEAAVQLQEMGVTGTGSTEHGDASGAIFWMRYQPDFLKCYYETYPDEMPSPQKAPTIELEPVAVDDGPDKPDVHPDYPHVRLGRAPVMGFFSITADTLVEMGPKSGSYKAAFECIIEAEDGRTCGVRREIYHKRDRAVSTSNLIAHLRTCAPNCPAHKAALMKIEASSKNCIECDGETVMVHNFSEAFSCATTISNLRPFLSLPPCAPRAPLLTRHTLRAGITWTSCSCMPTASSRRTSSPSPSSRPTCGGMSRGPPSPTRRRFASSSRWCATCRTPSAWSASRSSRCSTRASHASASSSIAGRTRTRTRHSPA